MRIGKKKFLAVFVVACAVGVVVVGSAAADPTFWAKSQINCADYPWGDVPFPTGSADHTDAIARVVADGSSVGYSDNSHEASWGGSDTFWMPVDTSSGFSVDDRSWSETCSGSFEMDVTDVPSAPTSFSGATTAGAENVDPYNATSAAAAAESALVYKAPIGDYYTAQVSLTQGAITLDDGGGHTQTFASSGTFDLGWLDAGDTNLFVETEDGSQAKWTITIAPASLTLTGTNTDPTFIRPGQIARLPYTLSTKATVSADVHGPTGVVRLLDQGSSESDGDHSLVWDGLDGSGHSVPDGNYRIRIAATNVFGSTASGDVWVVVDSRPPAVTFGFPHRVKLHRGLPLRITDTLSGWTTAWISVDGRGVPRRGFNVSPSGTGSFIVSRPRGWTRGRHVISVTAVDNAGNRATHNKTFVVPARG